MAPGPDRKRSSGGPAADEAGGAGTAGPDEQWSTLQDDDTVPEGTPRVEEPFPPGRCTLCGWQNDASDALCTGCGADLETGAPPPVDAFRPRRLDPRLTAAVGLLALVAVLAFAAHALLTAGADARLVAEGRALAAEGRADAAEEAFREALKHSQRNANAWAGLAESLLQQGRGEEALAVAERARELDPLLGEADLAYARAALATDGDLEVALQALLAAGRRPADDVPDLAHVLAHVRDARGERAEAIAGYRDALAQQPGSPEAPRSHLRLGRLLIETNRLGEAESHLELAAAGGAPAAAVRAAWADLQVRRGELGQALEAYREAVKLDPRDASIAFRKARLLLRHLERPDAALEALQPALRQEANQPAYLKLQGQALERIGELDDAHAAYKRAARHDPRDPEAFRLMAAIEASRDQLDSARANLEESLRLRRSDAETLAALAEVAGRQRDHAAAIDALQQAVRVAPGDANLHYLLGEAHLRRGERSEAMTALETSALTDPTFEAPLRRLVDLYGEDERHDDQARALQQLLEIRADDDAAAVALARLWILHTSERYYDRAIRILDGVLERDPEHEAARRLRGQAELQRFREDG